MTRIPHLLAILAVTACEAPEPSQFVGGGGELLGDDDGGADTGDTGGSDTGDDEPEYTGTLPSGEYLLGFAVAPVNDLLVPFYATVTPTSDGERPGIASLTMAPVDAYFVVGEDLVTVTDIRVAEDGSFTTDLGNFELPGAYSPTGSPAELEVVLTGTIADDGTFCGAMDGDLITFGIDLAGSTFGTVPWEAREDGAAQSCDGGTVEDLPRIEDCPDLAAGRVSEFVSGGEAREFELILPSDYDSTKTYPLVLGWHGITRDIEQLTEEHQIGIMADQSQVILAIPQAQSLGGAIAWDPYSAPATNGDLVLFDDIVTCVTEQYSVDTDRIHSLGFSNGGMLAGMLLALRPDVLASVTMMSGGLGQDFTDGARPTPTMVVWGGEEDSGSGTDFNILANEAVTTLGERGHPLVACNHELGHVIDVEWWPWVFAFFADHPMTEAGAPYAETGLPEAFPDFCLVP
jgi:predicted esterase